MSDSDGTSPASRTSKKAAAAKSQRPGAALPDDHKKFTLFPPWLKQGLKNKRAWKTWIRIMLCLIANLIMMVVHRSGC